MAFAMRQDAMACAAARPNVANAAGARRGVVPRGSVNPKVAPAAGSALFKASR
jgi:hypothetical protein